MIVLLLYAEYFSTKIFDDESSRFPHSHFMSVVLSCLQSCKKFYYQFYVIVGSRLATALRSLRLKRRRTP